MRVTAPVVLAAGAVLVGKAEGLQIERARNPQRLVTPSAYRKVPDSILVKLQKHGGYLPETQAIGCAGVRAPAAYALAVQREQVMLSSSKAIRHVWPAG